MTTKDFKPEPWHLRFDARSPDLFGVPPFEPPAQRHSPTSKAAAEKIKKAIGPMHKRILVHLAAYPVTGATDEEMQIELNMSANTQRPRRRELQLLGKIEDSGKTRPTRSGSHAVIWRLAQ